MKKNNLKTTKSFQKKLLKILDASYTNIKKNLFFLRSSYAHMIQLLVFFLIFNFLIFLNLDKLSIIIL